MLIYFLLFTALGFFIARQAKDTKNGFIIILSIDCLWILKSGAFWGLVSLGELLFGFSIYKFVLEEKKN